MAEDAVAKKYFMEHEQMDFEIQLMLGACYYSAADAGDILGTADRIESGDFESWVTEWHATAERVRGFADDYASKGQDTSAAYAYLRASGYYAATLSMIDGSKDPSRRLPYWKQHLACFEEFCSRLSPPAERLEIPYEDTTMPGWLFRPAEAGGPRPTVIFNNGSDGPTCSMWGAGVAGALRRGYAALVFDGPGQNSMLWLKKVPFRYDWEKVITPIVDFLLDRGEIDPERIALSGISQAGYWVLRALAFEKRIAAGILDPGVMDVFTTMSSRMPKEMLDLIDSGQKEQFDQIMKSVVDNMDEAGRQEIMWRMTPYGTDSFFDWYTAARRFNARDVVKEVECPMFIADPDDEQFWPGQSQEVYDALECPKTITRFTREEGANWHCEPKARSLYDERMFNWLATVMPAG